MSRPARVALRDPTPKLNEVKLQLCSDIKRAWRRQNWNQSQAALHSGTSRACMSKVDHLRVEELTISQLFRYLACAAPGFELLVSL